ncbi:MAG: glycosyltransferase [Acidaminococcaceae bacterium]
MANGLLIIGGCFPMKLEKEYLANSIGLPQIAADKLQKNILLGIKEITKKQPQMVTAPFVGYYPTKYKCLLVKSCSTSDEYANYEVVGFINLKGLETIVKAHKVYKEILKWYKESEENRNILVYSHYAAFMSAIGKAKRKCPGLKVCCIITDMPELSAKCDSLIEIIKKLPSRIMFNTTYRNIPYVDKFALLTKHMAESLNLSEDSYCVVECMCDSHNKEFSTIPSFERSKDEIIFTYTGTLDKLYGIEELLSSFQRIQNDSFRLWICGDGNGRADVQQACKDDLRIKYFGVLGQGKISEIQSMSDVLVNPRPNDNIFTKYSFPSKTIEYMMAGKPVIMYKLAGVPDEYDKYLFYFSESKGDMASDLVKIGEMPKSELMAAGQRNRKFAFHNKNYIVQTKKILKLMDVDYVG